MKISDPVSRKKRSLKLPASAVLTLKSPLRSEAVDSLIRDFVVAPPLERIESK